MSFPGWTQELRDKNADVFRSYSRQFGEESNLIYKQSAMDQLNFMFQNIHDTQGHYLEWIDYNYHVSKRCRLPCFSAKTEWGQFYYRDNFHNIVCSIELKPEIKLSSLLLELIRPLYYDKEPVHSTCAEGLEAVCYGLPKVNSQKYTVEIYSTEQFWTFLYLHRRLAV